MTTSSWRKLVSKVKALTSERKKPAGWRTRARSQSLSFEALETRLAPAVTTSLTNGVLDIAFSAANDTATVSHPTGSIRVVDGSGQVVGDFGDTLVKSINAHAVTLPGGITPSGQGITFPATVGLEEELSTSGLATVTINGTYTAGSVDVAAADSFRLAGGVLSTRKIAEGADPLTAPSLADSGDINIDAPAITRHW
jgi:hypothetical protein